VNAEVYEAKSCCLCWSQYLFLFQGLAAKRDNIIHCLYSIAKIKAFQIRGEISKHKIEEREVRYEILFLLKGQSKITLFYTSENLNQKVLYTKTTLPGINLN